MTRYCTLLFYWLMMLHICPAHGQNSTVLDQYIEIALANNLSLASVSLQESRQSSKIDQAKKLWQPNIDLNASYLLAEGGRKLLFPVGDLFNPANSALNQLTGSEQFPTDIENVETQLTPNNFLDANLSISKPIINSTIKYNIKIQKALLQLSEADKAIQRNELTFQVKQSYFNYLKSEQGVKIINENLSLLNDILAFNKKLIKYDKATPDIISDIDFQISLLESQIQGLREQQELSKVLFNILLNREVGEEIVIDTTLVKERLRSNYKFESLVESAFSKRPEFRKLSIADQVNELNGKRIDNTKKPTLGIRGAVGVQGEEFSFNEGGPLYTLGLNLGWNIWDGGLRKNQLEELKIAKEENQLEVKIAEQQITLQVAQAYHRLRSLYAMLDAEEAAIEAAAISYNAIDKRYRNDRALLIELLTAQNRLASSKLNKALVGIDILIAEADLSRITYE